MTKDEIKAKLDEAGVEYPEDALKNELEELLEGLPEDPEAEKEEAPKATVTRERDTVRILNGGGVFVREYSEKLNGEWAREHGYKNVVEMAKAYCDQPENKKRGYRVA